MWTETTTLEEFERLDDDEAERLIVDRFRSLADAGCDLEAALLLAVHPEVAVGQAADLLLRGHSPETALRALL